jgi:osmoprotectant transport system ATP-binding protein
MNSAHELLEADRLEAIQAQHELEAEASRTDRRHAEPEGGGEGEEVRA